MVNRVTRKSTFFDHLDNSDNVIDICEGYAPIILLFDKISLGFVPSLI